MSSAPRNRYTHGHHASVVAQHARRSAERDAAYLLPHLRPGMRLLDVGCGPGTITAGLARAVAPGAAIGVDVAASVVEIARAAQGAGRDASLRFATASVHALPWPDDCFDVVHAHQVLQHLSEPVAALREMRRVLRPGGLVAVRDSDYASMIGWPRLPEIERWLALYHAVAARNGADADAGRRLPAWLREAGFERVEASASPVVFADAEAVANWGESWARRTSESALAEQALEYGLASRQELDSIAAGWRRWARDPAAFFLYVNVECLARAPAPDC